MTSVVGVRSTFTCASCKTKQVVCQIVNARNPEFDMPTGWCMVAGSTYCGAHDPQAAAA